MLKSNVRLLKKVNLRARVLIVGAGRIGALFDTPNDALILSHAHACSVCDHIENYAFCDVDPDALKKACVRWNVEGFGSLSDAMCKFKPDIIIVCAPDKYHYVTLKELIRWKPRLVICEKPLTHDLTLTSEIVGLYDQNKIPLQVNFSRRFDTFVQKVRTEIREGKYGNVFNASCVYTKGILHNGSHAIDLLRFLLGKIDQIVVHSHFIDYDQNDRISDCWFKQELCPSTHLIAARENSYSIFEYDFVFEKGRLRFDNFGFRYHFSAVQNDPLFSGYSALTEPVTGNTGLATALSNCLQNGLEFLSGGSLICPGVDALKTQEVCYKIASTMI